jgi:uncharacterized membrane protein YqiK
MRFRRKRRPVNGALTAAAEAIISRERAEAELARQKATADAEAHHVLAPLRRMRERNHIAEDFAAAIRRGYSQ